VTRRVGSKTNQTRRDFAEKRKARIRIWGPLKPEKGPPEIDEGVVDMGRGVAR
jgi:hypothetical protein